MRSLGDTTDIRATWGQRFDVFFLLANARAPKLRMGNFASDLSFESLSVDQTWPMNDSIVATHPFTRCSSPSIFDLGGVNGQQHVQHFNLSESAIYAGPVPQTYVNHDSWSDCALQEDIAGIEQPQVDSCLTRPESEVNHDQLYLDPNHKCSCMNCLFLGISTEWPVKNGSGYILACRFSGCQEQILSPYYFAMRDDLTRHERAHFGKIGDYHCEEQGCKTSTKKWADLRRHCLNRHCTNATKFPCPALGCKYGGDNCFTREDKLKSHHRNVHQGKVVPGKAFQPIKPKANGAKVIKGKPQVVQTIKPKPSAAA